MGVLYAEEDGVRVVCNSFIFSVDEQSVLWHSEGVMANHYMTAEDRYERMCEHGDPESAQDRRSAWAFAKRRSGEQAREITDYERKMRGEEHRG